MLSLDVLRIMVASLTLNSIASISDFFTQKIKIGALEFKVWMLLVMAVALVVLVILCIMLAVLNAKEKKLKNAEKLAVEDKSENADTPIDEVVEESVDDTNQVDNSEESKEVIEDEPKSEEIEIVENENTDSVNSVENEPIEEPVFEEVVEDKNEEKPVTAEESAEEVCLENEEAAADSVEDEKNDKIQENNLEEAKDKTMKNQDDVITKTVVGKLNYYLTESGYYFSLDANNGQELFVSYSYTSLDGAMKGFETFAKAVKEGKFIVIQDKNGRFKYILNKKYQGPNYKNRAACENSIASVKKFAQSYKVNIIEPDEETKKAFAEYLDELKKSKDIDWDQIAKEEAVTPKSGSFEIEEGEDGYRFYLYANNRQILYSSNIYSQAKTCASGIDAFKKAVYGGVVVIEKDKFGNYRYILRNSTTVTYAGESFNSEASARSSFESVKRFVKSATIVPFKKKADDEE